MTLISLIIPTFNEKQILTLLCQLTSFLKILPYRFELILVDDSTDNTPTLIQRFLDSNQVAGKLIRGDGRGKGSAIRIGTYHIEGDIAFCMDADLTIPLENIPCFIQFIQEKNYDVVMGERYTAKNFSKFLASPLRFILSVFLLLLQRYFIFQSHTFYDTQCGFKAFKKQAIQSIAHLQRVSGGMYDIEYLYIAKKNNFRIYTHKVNPLPEVRESTIRVFRCMVQDPLDLLRTKLFGILGFYTLKPQPKKPIDPGEISKQFSPESIERASSQKPTSTEPTEEFNPSSFSQKKIVRK